MKKTNRSLALERQTLRTLGNEVASVHGGEYTRGCNTLVSTIGPPSNYLPPEPDPRRANTEPLPRAPRENP